MGFKLLHEGATLKLLAEATQEMLAKYGDMPVRININELKHLSPVLSCGVAGRSNGSSKKFVIETGIDVAEAMSEIMSRELRQRDKKDEEIQTEGQAATEEAHKCDVGQVHDGDSV